MLESPHSKIILGLLSATFLIFYADIIIGSYLGFSTEVLFGRGMILACYLIVIFIIFKAFTQSVKKEKDLEGKVLESMLKEQSFEILKEQILSAMKTHEQTLRIHHDMKNMLLGFEGYLKSGDSKGMKDYYYSSVLPQHEKIDKEELYLLPLVRLENIAIQGMLRGKLADAMNLGVEVSLELEDEIQEISMNPIDLIRVLGILLDNAIEAALETNAPVIKMAFIKEENRLLIVVQNNFKGEIPFDEMYRHGFSTKGEDRGIGLSNLAEILEESEGVQVYHEVEGDLFVQHLEIIGGD
ncbi:MAG: GHKL domain-containing protein [Turicibacter sp.]|nr:GHKL domain-containing protein [Turicibacter sp.]